MNREEALNTVFGIFGIGLLFEAIAVGVFSFANPIGYKTVFIRENLYYVLNILPFVAYNITIALTIIVILFVYNLNNSIHLVEPHFSRFSVLFTIGSLLVSLTSFFNTNLSQELFVSDLGLYGDDRMDMYLFGLNFSLIDAIAKIVGYLFLLIAWIQFSKCTYLSNRESRSRYLMIILTSVAIVLEIITVPAIWYEIFLLRTGHWYSPITRATILDIIAYPIWAFSPFLLPLMFSIGYLIVGRQKKSMERREIS